MALRFVDGFDHYDRPQATRKWTNIFSSHDTWETTTTNARFGLGRCFYANGGTGFEVRLIKFLDSQATFIAGLAYRNNGGVFWPTTIFGFMDSLQIQTDVRQMATGKLVVTRDGTNIGSDVGNFVMASNTYYYLEFKCTFKTDATGSFTLKANGTTIRSGTNVQTSATANNTANQIYIGSNSALGAGWDMNIDDLYLCDATGASNNDFLGDMRVRTLVPTSDGTYTAWTPTPSGTHFNKVNEIPATDDTNYVETSTVNNVDSYNFTQIITNPMNVKGVQMCICARKTDAGTMTLNPFIRTSDSVDRPQAVAMTLTDNYIYHNHVQAVDPATSAAWTISNLNATQFGVKLV